MKRNQTIYRRVATGGFVQLSNGLVRDKDMSYGARGLLAMALSNSDEWVTNRSYFVNNTTDGQFRVKKYFKELESKGYVHYQVTGGKDGFCNIWTFYDQPLPEDKRSNRTNWKTPVLKVSSALENQCTGILDHIRTPISQNTNIQNTIYDSESIVSGYGDEEEYQGEIRGLW
jgi:hypothetical protein